MRGLVSIYGTDNVLYCNLIRSIRQLTFNTTLLRTSSLLTLSVKFQPHFISRIYSFLLSALLISHASALNNAVGKTTWYQ